jgi:hypothetical protein
MITLSQIIQSEDNFDYPSYMLNVFETLGIDYAICKNQDEQTRKEIFHAYLAGRPIDKSIDCQRLSRLTSGGYISSDIRQICDEAAARAFHEDAFITQQLLEQVIREGGPSVNKNELKTYEESRKHIDPAIRHTASLNQIGFR